MAKEQLRKDDESTTLPNRAQRRHPKLPAWLLPLKKLNDEEWQAKVRKERKRKRKIIAKERRRNVQKRK